jgi:hypothetical protein
MLCPIPDTSLQPGNSLSGINVHFAIDFDGISGPATVTAWACVSPWLDFSSGAGVCGLSVKQVCRENEVCAISPPVAIFDRWADFKYVEIGTDRGLLVVRGLFGWQD